MSPKAVTNLPPVSSATDDGDFPTIYWNRRFDVRHLSPIPVIATLDIEYNELTKAWKTLEELPPPSDQVIYQERPQTAQDVRRLVHDIQASWASNPKPHLFSRSVALCDAFSTTLDSHTTTLMALPGRQFYSAVFYGVLQSIIKASARYPRIIEGVMKALVEVNHSISPPDGEPLQLSRASIPSVAMFYSHVFLFLGELVDWYARRFKCRLLNSRHENVYSDFCSLVSTIQRTAANFMHPGADGHENVTFVQQYSESYSWEDARLNQIGHRQNARRNAAQTAFTRLLIWEIQHHDERRLKLLESRGLLLLQLLRLASQQLRPIGGHNECTVCLTSAPGQDLLLSPSPLEKSKHKYIRVELQSFSAHLQDYFDEDDQIANQIDADVTVGENVMESLKQWAIDTYSQVLVVQSPPGGLLSPVGLIASCYANLARETIPVIVHLCSLPAVATTGNNRFQQGLIALVYSLIRQLLEYLPPVVNGSSSCTIKVESFSPLDGTLASWKEVLSLVDTLLYYAPPLLMCIVDGLDKLQDPSTDQYIRSLVRVFVSHTRKPSSSKPGEQSVLLKVLFTVSEQPESLMETLCENPLTLSESNGLELAITDTPSASEVEMVLA
ncbi:hypothetical protein BJY04DRAFT_207894 [Aspergillus karnatakaensis]|uniref:uncharacterized protein n=1 Tax=Aspergillus karnatakaensis TaxID=1810916 RepID=UPI003CCCE7E0